MKTGLRHAFYLSGLGFILALGAMAQDRPVVFVSIPPQAWLVRRLAGEAVDVQTLLPAGANPHLYEPTARQVKSLAQASFYFTLGLPFETTLATRTTKLGGTVRVAPMDLGIAKLGAHAHGEGCAHGTHTCGGAGGDPHIWLAPHLLSAMASNTVAALAQAMPQQREALADALTKTVAEITATDEAVRQVLRSAPQRTCVVYHPSWSYFAKAYGLSLLVIEQDGKAPSARHLANVIRQAKEAGVKVVFAEPQYDLKSAQTLAKQVGAQLETVDPLQEDWPALMRKAAAKLATE